ncbi:helix-turn-helix transcriptional regulator [Bradyrhizobium erythrophlei]|jgi:prophage regulatory protein|uniref:helix-turn-helix transcriptional regulator n=1 Tax=Bradyrhizobium erythrophlei TaxID=1437360 RepID=UPI0009A888CE|nr:AlpA family phage regulatory protein [Bradyrhizobium erythrophlei]
MGRNLKKQPYSPEEKRIVQFIAERDSVGRRCFHGDDPVGFILASYGWLIKELKRYPEKLLTYEELKSTRGIGFSRQHLHRLESQKQFPGRVQIGDHHIGWLAAEMDDWIEARAAGRLGWKPNGVRK